MTQTLFSSTTTPLTPPTAEEDRLSWLRLIRSRRVGVATFFKLMREYGSAAAALDALPKIAADAGVHDYAPFPESAARKELDQGRKLGAGLICFADPEYPKSLSQISDPPPVFWALGDTSLLQRPMIAMVGARNTSGLGERMARKLATDLGTSDQVIVSGLARGIDAAAHDAALPTGTIAVLGGGIDVFYPRENTHLQHQIAENGLLIAEQSIGLAPQAKHFPRRNRIISGLSQGVVVVEAAARSGSLITARNALDQGRDVLAVPGHPFDARASGCNMLIRDGACLVRSAEDILTAISLPQEPITQEKKGSETSAYRPIPLKEPKPQSTPTMQTVPRDLTASILAHLGPSPMSEDQLIRDMQTPTQQVSACLLELELDGLIIRHPGGIVSLCPEALTPAPH